jgi:hypothetical protein
VIYADVVLVPVVNSQTGSGNLERQHGEPLDRVIPPHRETPRCAVSLMFELGLCGVEFTKTDR